MKRSQWRGVVTLVVLIITIVSLFVSDWWWIIGLLVCWMFLPYVTIAQPLNRHTTWPIAAAGGVATTISLVFSWWLFAAIGVIITGLVMITRYQAYRVGRFIKPSKWIYTTSSDWLYAMMLAIVGVLVLSHQVTSIELLGCDDINRFLTEQSGWITRFLDDAIALAQQWHINLDNTIIVYRQKYQSISQSSCDSIITRGHASNLFGTAFIILISLSVIIYPILMINLWILSLINMVIWTPLVRWSGLQQITQQTTQYRIIPKQ